MIAGFLANKGAITVCPPCQKAYPWATEQDWKDAITRHHGALELAGAVLQEPVESRVPAITGTQHGLVHAYYFNEDEDLTDADPDLDAYAHQVWAEEEVLGPDWDQ
jgi:hypothetical protein